MLLNKGRSHVSQMDCGTVPGTHPTSSQVSRNTGEITWNTVSSQAGRVKEAIGVVHLEWNADGTSLFVHSGELIEVEPMRELCYESDM